MDNKTTVSRRNFLKIAGLALGGTVLACSGAGFLATQQPVANFIQTDCGGETMNDKILIAYASKCGSTGEVAEAMAEALCAQGASVDIKLAKDVTSLDGYSRVIIGSAIRMGLGTRSARGHKPLFRRNQLTTT